MTMMGVGARPRRGNGQQTAEPSERIRAKLKAALQSETDKQQGIRHWTSCVKRMSLHLKSRGLSSKQIGKSSDHESLIYQRAKELQDQEIRGIN